MKVNWLDFTPDDFIDRLNARPVCYVPCGYAECHGVYNCLGVDWYYAEGICNLTAHRYGGIVAPPMAFHVDEEPMFDWATMTCGMGKQLTAAIPNFLFLQNLLYQLRAYDARGFHAVIVFSGHSVPGLKHDVDLLLDYYRLKTGSPMRIVFGCEWELCSVEKFPNDPHAGTAETSYLMYFKPELTHPELLCTQARHPEVGGGNEEFSAYCAARSFGSDPKYVIPSREIGERKAMELSAGLGKLAETLLAEYTCEDRPAAPDYYRTAEIWTSFERITSRYWKSSMTNAQYLAGTPHPEFPGWDAFGIEGTL